LKRPQKRKKIIWASKNCFDQILELKILENPEKMNFRKCLLRVVEFFERPKKINLQKILELL